VLSTPRSRRLLRCLTRNGRSNRGLQHRCFAPPQERLPEATDRRKRTVRRRTCPRLCASSVPRSLSSSDATSSGTTASYAPGDETSTAGSALSATAYRRDSGISNGSTPSGFGRSEGAGPVARPPKGSWAQLSGGPATGTGKPCAPRARCRHHLPALLGRSGRVIRLIAEDRYAPSPTFFLLGSRASPTRRARASRARR
jgi:hypothetical protein